MPTAESVWEGVEKRLYLCHGTLASASPVALVEAASRAGFFGVSLKVVIPRPAIPVKILGDYSLLGDTRLRRETRHLIEATGMVVREAETAVLAPDMPVATMRPLLESAAFLGAPATLVVFFGVYEEARLMEQFHDFAALADSYGQLAIIEFLPVSAVPSAYAAGRLIECSGAANARIMVDSLHLTRSGGGAATLTELHSDRLYGLQISDGPRDLPFDGMNWWQEMSGARAFPGEGDIDLAGMVRALPPDLPVGVEVISRAFQDRGLSALEMAQYAMTKTRAFFERVA